MKLYTEESILSAIALARMSEVSPYDLLEQLTPIELPSDEEIEDKFKIKITMYDLGYSDGAKWMKEQITKTK